MNLVIPTPSLAIGGSDLVVARQEPQASVLRIRMPCARGLLPSRGDALRPNGIQCRWHQRSLLSAMYANRVVAAGYVLESALSPMPQAIDGSIRASRREHALAARASRRAVCRACVVCDSARRGTPRNI